MNEINEHQYLEELRELRNQNWPEATPREPRFPFGERPISEYLSLWAEHKPSEIALHFYGYSLTYRQLDQLSNQFAHWLVRRGIGPGEPVAVLMPNCPQFLIAFYGILKIGAIYHPVSPLSREMELQHQLSDCLPSAVVCFDALLPLLMPVAESLGIQNLLATSLSELATDKPPIPMPDIMHMEKQSTPEGVDDFYPSIMAMPASAPSHQAQLDDIAAVNYTGGTTGLPKGCIHTHRHIIYTCGSFFPAVTGTEPKSYMTLGFLPMFWIAGENNSLLFPIFSGSTQVLLCRWDAEAFMAAVQHYKVQMTTLLVDSADEVLNHPDRSQYDFSSLQSTSAISFIKKLTIDYRQRWQGLTGCTLFEAGYGMTETNTSDTFTAGFQQDNWDLQREPGFIGMPVPGTEFKVCDFETHKLLALGEDGELCIRSPSIFSGYWNKPELNNEIFADGWFRTGDLGCIDQQGFLRYIGRRKEMIKVNGMSVFPTELETMLGRHQAILGSAVIAREDADTGQRPVAFVVLRGNSDTTIESLNNWCREHMAVYKVPEIRLLESLPMTATGKVIKKELESLL